MTMARSKLLILALALALSACTTVQHRPVALPLIARPTLPTVKPAEVQCLADDVYMRLVDRERGYKGWGMQYEAEVKANNAKAKQ